MLANPFLPTSKTNFLSIRCTQRPSQFAATCVLVDKLEKVPVSAVSGDLKELGITEEQIERLTTVLTNKDLSAIESAFGCDSSAVADLKDLFELLDGYGISDWFEFDASVVRGLSYYTGVVFEAFDRTGTLRAIAGGGRYDKLLESFGGDATPAVGFGFGDAVIVELLKDKGLLPSFKEGDVDAMVFSLGGEDDMASTMDAARRLRAGGWKVDVVLEGKKAKWVFKHADRWGAASREMRAEKATFGDVDVQRQV